MVAVLHMGAAGAAFATVFAQMVSVVISFLLIRKKQLPFTFTLSNVRPDGAIIKKIIALGTPIAFQDLLVGISFLVVLAIVIFISGWIRKPLSHMVEQMKARETVPLSCLL